MTNIEGIRFTLSGTSNDGQKVEMVAITDKNGLAAFENIPAGRYTLTEDSHTVPTGYLTASPKQVIIDSDKAAEVYVRNNKQPEKPVETGFHEENPMLLVMFIGITAIALAAVVARKKEEKI